MKKTKDNAEWGTDDRTMREVFNDIKKMYPHSRTEWKKYMKEWRERVANEQLIILSTKEYKHFFGKLPDEEKK